MHLPGGFSIRSASRALLPLAGLVLVSSLAISLASGGCKAKPASKKGKALVTPMDRDLDRICNAEEKSGALDRPPGDRAMHTGIWLATQLESQEGRDLSAQLSPMSASERGKRLKEVLAEHGIEKCEILYAWGTP